MNSKTSFFNKSLFKSDMKRFWWLGLLEAALILIFTVAPVYERILREGVYSYGLNLPSWSNFGIVVILTFPIGIATILFSYMHFGGSVSSHHSLPVKRTAIMTTKIVSGAILTIIPIIINGLFFMGMILMPDLMTEYGFGDVLKWIFAGILYTSVLLSLTVCVNVMAGNPIGTLIFTGGFAFLPLLLLTFFSDFLSDELHGFTGRAIDNFASMIYIPENKLVQFPYFFDLFGNDSSFYRRGIYSLQKAQA